MQPFISIVCPTKDRPECVELLLRSVKNQTFDNYEIIISDNAYKKPSKEIVEKYSHRDDRVKYVRTSRCIGLCDSFEFAISQAHGKYVMMVEDKWFLYPDSLEKISKILKDDPIDILNYPFDMHSPYDRDRNILNGKLTYALRSGTTIDFDLEEMIKNRFDCERLMLDLEKEWSYGTILGGVVSAEFINQIRKINDSGRFFDGRVPDRYNALESLMIVKKEKIKYLDDHIAIYSSNGRSIVNNNLKIKDIYETVQTSNSNIKDMEDLLFPGVISAIDVICTDFKNAQNYLIKKGLRKKQYSLPRGLILAVIEKRMSMFANDKEEYNNQMELIKKYVAAFSDQEKKQYEDKWKQMKKGPLLRNVYSREYDFPGDVMKF